jgi:hypothetical protein
LDVMNQVYLHHCPQTAKPSLFFCHRFALACTQPSLAKDAMANPSAALSDGSEWGRRRHALEHSRPRPQCFCDDQGQASRQQQTRTWGEGGTFDFQRPHPRVCACSALAGLPQATLREETRVLCCMLGESQSPIRGPASATTQAAFLLWASHGDTVHACPATLSEAGKETIQDKAGLWAESYVAPLQCTSAVAHA